MRHGLRYPAVLVTTLLVAVLLAGTRPADATTTSVATEAEYRAALAALSADTTGPHTVTLTADITLTAGGDPTYTGDQPLTIDGDGHTIDANHTSRTLSTSSYSAAVTIQDVTIRNGLASSANGGGGISVNGAVTVTNSTVTDNTATVGVAYGGGIYANGAVTVTNSSITDNTVIGGTTGMGGGLYGYGAVTVTDSTIAGNTANGGTYGIGGGVHNSEGVVAVTRSTITGNTANGGTQAFGGGVNADAMTVTDTTISGNAATAVAGGFGGGTYTEGGVTVTNSTISGNAATTFGGGVFANGAMVATHATVVENSATNGANLNGANLAVASLAPFGSVFAGPVGGTNCSVSDVVTSQGHNWATDSSCALTGTGDTQNGADPQLGPLADNGGPTWTRQPAIGSPLVNAIPNGACSAAAADQRGSPRPSPVGGACDIGAVENDLTAPTVGLVTPPEGAVYARDQVVNADYSCADTGSGLADPGGCVATPDVPVSSPIDTSTLGDHQFAVTATDRAGNQTTVTHTYTVALARPDGRIQRGTSPLRGNDIYNTLTGQTVTGSARPGATVTYYASIQNDAPFPDTLRIRGQGSTTRFTLTYRNPAGTNITTAVRNGTYTTPTLAPGATHKIKITVTIRRTAPTGATLTRTLTTYSTTHPTRTDTVRTTTRRT